MHLFSPWQNSSKLGSAHLAHRKGSYLLSQKESWQEIEEVASPVASVVASSALVVYGAEVLYGAEVSNLGIA